MSFDVIHRISNYITPEPFTSGAPSEIGDGRLLSKQRIQIGRGWTENYDRAVKYRGFLL
jgi:hypothetical protein